MILTLDFTVICLSVEVLIVTQGTPNKEDSSWIPPESVKIILQLLITVKKSINSSGLVNLINFNFYSPILIKDPFFLAWKKE